MEWDLLFYDPVIIPNQTWVDKIRGEWLAASSKIKKIKKKNTPHKQQHVFPTAKKSKDPCQMLVLRDLDKQGHMHWI